MVKVSLTRTARGLTETVSAEVPSGCNLSELIEQLRLGLESAPRKGGKRCGLCGQVLAEVEFLVAAAGDIYVCDECVERASTLIATERQARQAAKEAPKKDAK